MNTAKKNTPHLIRTLSLFEVTVAGIGIILGAGIYALIGAAAAKAGNAAWIGFLISAVIAAFTAFSYAELASFFKGDAGEYDYCHKALGKKIAYAVALMMIFTGIITATTVALGFAGYFLKFFAVEALLAAFGVILLMSVINYIGIRESNRFNLISTFVEFLGLVIIIIIGIPHIGQVNILDMPNGWHGVFQSTGLVFFAFLGFEAILKFREETVNPDKTMPKAIIASLAITTIVYILVSISAVSILEVSELAVSTAPLATVAGKVLGPVAILALGIFALFSTSNTILISLLTTSRMIFGMAERNSLPRFFSYVSPKTHTPVLAVVAVFILAAAFLFVGDIETVAVITNILLLLSFAFVNLSAIILRYKINDTRVFKMPVNIGRFPVLSAFGVMTSLALAVFNVIDLLQY